MDAKTPEQYTAAVVADINRMLAEAEAAPAEEFVILRNDRTSYYEVHRAGCRHQIARHMERMTSRTAESGAAVKAWFEAGNEDCLAKIGPCAR